MNKISEEELREFWEWCGFREIDCPDPDNCYFTIGVGHRHLAYPDGRYQVGTAKCIAASTFSDYFNDKYSYRYPVINLDNLFRYAIPALKILLEYRRCSLESVEFSENSCFILYWRNEPDIDTYGVGIYSGEDVEPAIALYNAIQEARRKTRESEN